MLGSLGNGRFSGGADAKGARRRRTDGENMADHKGSNNVHRLREDQLLSKAELARRAGVSVLTIDRVERGESCRLDTKRKIILALGMKVQDKDKVFEDARRRDKGGRKF
jgi:DNA-binding XRE family transcriptional regulator